MKDKRIIGMIVMATLFAAFATFGAGIAKADQINMDISVNGTADLNITIDADDTEARAAIGATQEDVYGTGVGSTDTTTTTVPTDGVETATIETTTTTTTVPANPVDEVLSDITAGTYLTMEQICDDYYRPENFQSINVMAPADFVAQLKALGYDDETHINTVWNLCQQRYIDSQNQALQGSMSTGFSLMSSLEGTSNDIVNSITGAVKWLMNGGDAPTEYKALGSALASYFASKQDLAALGEYSYGNINKMNIRLEAVERTLERISPEEYCKVKIELMEKYNLSAVKCGENSTWYYKIPGTSTEKGYSIIGITPLPESLAPTVAPLATPPAEPPVVQLPEPLIIASQPPMSGNAVVPILLKNLSNEALLNRFSDLSTNMSEIIGGISSGLLDAATLSSMNGYGTSTAGSMKSSMSSILVLLLITAIVLGIIRFKVLV